MCILIIAKSVESDALFEKIKQIDATMHMDINRPSNRLSRHI